MFGGFSRFHVTIDPRNASSTATLDPKTSTAQLKTLDSDDPLAFRAYRPKTTPSAIVRILVGIRDCQWMRLQRCCKPKAQACVIPLFLYLSSQPEKLFSLDRRKDLKSGYHEIHSYTNYPTVSAICV